MVVVAAQLLMQKCQCKVVADRKWSFAAGDIQRMPIRSLTSWEWRALERGINLADGHARQLVCGHEQELVKKLPEIYEESYGISQREAERRFLRAYWALVRPEITDETQQPLFHYSSSLSIDAVAKFLSARALETILITPTFDNIPAILRRSGVKLSPVHEDQIVDLASNAVQQNRRGQRAIFLVNPNNPTGRFFDATELTIISEYCSKSGTVLIIDNSFRGFSPLLSYDDLALLRKGQCSFISIEDTGKFFSTNDIKVGFLLTSPDLYDELAAVTDEIMLNVSPFALLFLAAISEKLVGDGGRSQILNNVATNRDALDQTLIETSLRVIVPKSPIGVGWVELPSGWVGQQFVNWLAHHDFGILPGNPFYWHEPTLGDRFVRIALMREETYFARAIKRFVELVRIYEPSKGEK